ncbi:MAG: ATP-binding protein [Caulobacterales bacterium]|nr:ATP-binding protein [Caulobacterales bacterium]MCA0373967.1 ATP-binding protein [Pseudomonadota bacterium]
MLLEGPAGVGKSHLLADIVDFQLEHGRPAIFISGGSFNESNTPWSQVIQEVGLPPTTRIQDFLGALNAAGETAGIRLMLCIDALNERHGIDIWPHRLAAFISEANKFPYICIGLSCRSTFISYIIPQELYDNIPHLTHPGFGEDGGAAAKYYLQARGIARVGAPNTVNEFNNPLFLKTCCDSLEREGKSELPKGLQGVTKVFDFYHTAITNALTRRMKLDPFQQISKRALENFSKLLLASGNNYATVPDALVVFEDIYPSNGDSDRSLLSQLEHEGVLTTEYVRQADGSDCQMVRFTFERLSDYNLAERLIAEHLDPACPINAFVRGENLHELLFGDESYRFSGIIEALAVLLPEKFDLEILDLGEVSYNVIQAFKESLLWRNHEYFSDRTFELLNQYLPEESLSIILSIATEPRNKFNADFLHEQLWPMSMPTRDEKWSIPIVSDYFAPTAIDTLISWASENGFFEIDEDRARLTATTLAWLLCVTNRPIRDKATKALATIFAPRLYLAAEIVAKFANVNDQYIIERVLAAAYGGALQGLTTDGLNTLAQSVFDSTLGKCPAPINALIRDNAYGLLKFAELKGFLPAKIAGVSIDPPYKSHWPLEFVPDDEIEKFEVEVETGKRTYDQIVSSTINDGDFARYVIDSRLDDWSPASNGSTKFPTYRDVFESWMSDFEEYSAEAQVVAFNELFEVIKKINEKEKIRYREPPELKEANQKFKQTLSSDLWEDYRVRAKNYLEVNFFENSLYDSEARFDTRWCRRWICKRAHELGWEHGRFYEFDSSTSSDRNDHRLERIGKKYQWIALHELAGRMSDNLAFLGGYKKFDNGEFRGLADARKLGLREIDPSLLVLRTQHEGWEQPKNCWWTPFNPYLKKRDPLERLQWLEDDSSIVNGEAMIELNEPKSGRKWLALDTFGNWKQRGVFNNRETIQQDIWYRLRCVIVKKQDLNQFIFDIKDKSLTNPDTFRQFELHGEIFLGEYPWHPSLDDLEDWRDPELRSKVTVPHRATTAEYICERGGYDHSIDKTVALNLPAPWLADVMGLRLSNGKELNYVNSRGEVIFKDPSVLNEGPNAAVIDKDAFLDILENEELCPVWIFAGEKNIYGGSDAGSGFGGCRIYSSVFCIEGKERKIVKKAEFKDRLDPNEDQLLKFFEGDKVPAGNYNRSK